MQKHGHLADVVGKDGCADGFYFGVVADMDGDRGLHAVLGGFQGEATAAQGNDGAPADFGEGCGSAEAYALHVSVDQLAVLVVSVDYRCVGGEGGEGLGAVGEADGSHGGILRSLDGEEKRIADGALGAIAQMVDDAGMGGPHGRRAAAVHVQGVVAAQGGHQVGALIV